MRRIILIFWEHAIHTIQNRTIKMTIPDEPWTIFWFSWSPCAVVELFKKQTSSLLVLPSVYEEMDNWLTNLNSQKNTGSGYSTRVNRDKLNEFARIKREKKRNCMKRKKLVKLSSKERKKLFKVAQEYCSDLRYETLWLIKLFLYSISINHNFILN